MFILKWPTLDKFLDDECGDPSPGSIGDGYQA